MFFLAQSGGVQPDIVIAPNSAAIGWTDYGGVIDATAERARIIRPIDTIDQGDPAGAKWSAPGARAAVSLTLAQAGNVTFDLYFSGLHTRLDSYNAKGALLVDGARTVSFDFPLVGGVIPTGPMSVSTPVPAGTHTVATTFPMVASMEVRGIRRPFGSLLNPAPLRLPFRIVLIGDSRFHGMGANSALETIAEELRSLGYDVAVLANGGRQLARVDYQKAAELAPDVAFALFDFNNFKNNGVNLAGFQALYQQGIADYLAGCSGKLRVVTSFASTSDADWTGTPGAFHGNNPTLEQYRAAERAAVAAIDSARVKIVEGRGAGQPTAAASNAPDGIHYNSPAQATQGQRLGTAI